MLSYYLAMQLYDQSCSRRSSGQAYRTVSDMVACDKQKKPSQTTKKPCIRNTSSTITPEDPLWAATFYVTNVCHPVLCWWKSSIGIMPRLRAWCSRNHCSTPGRGKTSFLQSIKNGLGHTHPHIQRDRRRFPFLSGATAAKTWIWSLTPSRVEAKHAYCYTTTALRTFMAWKQTTLQVYILSSFCD